ncbi:MAG: glutamyl-tRNA reductase [Legionellales bacterium]|nr:glutamyl-tRNA reductase [Legionellales bacterium]
MQAFIVWFSMIYLFGIKFDSMACVIRQSTAVMDEQQQAALTQELMACPEIQEAIIMPTCNRFEIVLDCEPHASLALFITHWVCSFCNCSPSFLSEKSTYELRDIEAVNHLIIVAAGLDSPIMGETQIFGQIKQAFNLSQRSGCIKGSFYQLFNRIFHAAKKIRSETQVHRWSPTLSQRVRKIVAKEKSPTILVIGYGSVSQSIIDSLKGHTITITSRNINHIKPRHQYANCIDINQALNHLNQYDIIISATRSKDPVIHPYQLTALTKDITLIDLAVPHDVDPSVKQMDHVRLVDLDHIQQQDPEVKKTQMHQHLRAEKIAQCYAEWIMDLIKLDHRKKDIRAIRNKIDQMQQDALTAALKSLRNGSDPESVLRQHFRLLTNKILHKPTIHLKKAIQNDENTLVDFTKHLFEVDGEC